MSKAGSFTAVVAVLGVLFLIAGCGSSAKPAFATGEILFSSVQIITPTGTQVQPIGTGMQVLPDGGAGQRLEAILVMEARGGASDADLFEVTNGALPDGVRLIPDLADNDGDGLADPGGAPTGNARLTGFPRTGLRTFAFTVRAVATQGFTNPGTTGNPAFSASQQFEIFIDRGQIAILTPTADEGTTDPLVPAVPGVFKFVNPTDISSFTSFKWLVAGGTGDNEIHLYLPREVELSVFDTARDGTFGAPDLLPDERPKWEDSDETETGDGAKPAGASGNGSGNLFKVDFLTDGGVFTSQVANEGVQLGAFPSPRGPVGTVGNFNNALAGDITAGGYQQNLVAGEGLAFADTLNPAWFQPAALTTVADSTLLTGIPELPLERSPADLTINFTRYDLREGISEAGPRKYPFPQTEYAKAFSLSFHPPSQVNPSTGLQDPTPLRYVVIVEAIDKKFDPVKANHDVVRRAYAIQVEIPLIEIETPVLRDATAGQDYAELIQAKGGVPPLKYELEWVDATDDDKMTGTFFGSTVGDTGGSSTASDPLNDDPAAATVPAGVPAGKFFFGLDMDEDLKQFLGVPKAASAPGTVVEATVRVFASVLNPSQDPNVTPVPISSVAGEFNGASPADPAPAGQKTRGGAHKVFDLKVNDPLPFSITTAALAPGQDGEVYAPPGFDLVATGGVPFLNPQPIPQANASGTSPRPYSVSAVDQNYRWSSTYDQDTSFATPAAGVAGLPTQLTLQGDELLPDSGRISGTTTDRGFHPVHLRAEDFYLGPAQSPSIPAVPTDATVPGKANFAEKTLVLSVGPDSGVYLRGVQTAEGAGGKPSGLAFGTRFPTTNDDPRSEPTNVPLAGEYSLFTIDQGRPASKTLISDQGSSQLPLGFDLLPVMIPHGDDDEGVYKTLPSVSGFWPPESGTDDQWEPRLTSGGWPPWQHLQQLMTWIQLPPTTNAQGASGTPVPRRIFLWAETNITAWNTSATSSGHSKRYQELDTTGKRGVLMVDPISGDFWNVAVLNNDGTPPAGTTATSVGTTFGAEAVLQNDQLASTSFDSTLESFVSIGYWKARRRQRDDTRWDREVQVQGLGSWIERARSSSSSQGWYRTPQGRSAVSVAVSADGLWAATALPGPVFGNAKILLWRTDKQPLGANVLAAGHVHGIAGEDRNGAALPNSAAVIELVQGTTTAATAGGGSVTITGDQLNLLPDSLKFVEGGLIFLMQGQYDHVFGLNLQSGALTAVDLKTQESSDNPIDPDKGFYIPDQDYVRGFMTQNGYQVQFAFAGDVPDGVGPGSFAGVEGPDTIAFVAGSGLATKPFTALLKTGSQPDIQSDAYPRPGWEVRGNRPKDLFVLHDPAAGVAAFDSTNGLNLANATLTNLTRNPTTGASLKLTDPLNSPVGGDLLTPGRFGEEQDHLAVSDDGKFVAVVRDVTTNDNSLVQRQATFAGGGLGFASVPITDLAISFGDTNTTSSPSYTKSDDVLLFSVDAAEGDTTADLDTKAGIQHFLYLGTGHVEDPDSSSKTSLTRTFGDSPGLPPEGAAPTRGVFNARFRRVTQVFFSPHTATTKERSLIVEYSGDDWYSVNYLGSSFSSSFSGRPHNMIDSTSTFATPGTEMLARIQYVDDSGVKVPVASLTGTASNTTSGTSATQASENMLAGLKLPSGGAASVSLQGVGDTVAPFSTVWKTSSSSSYVSGRSFQQFFTYFYSADRNFLYCISDQFSIKSPSSGPNSGNFMVGWNMTTTDIPDAAGTIHKPFVPFSPVPGGVGFEQFDVNSWNYNNRFFAVPGGTVNGATGRDGSGIVVFIANDPASGATSSTNLEIYAFDANVGGPAVAVTGGSDPAGNPITGGTSNAINHPYLSTDGNTLVFQRSETTQSSKDDRRTLTGNSDLGVVRNIHELVTNPATATPLAFYVSQNMSHGHSIAFTGEAKAGGPFGLIFSQGPASPASNLNLSWETRTLRLVDLGQAQQAVLNGTTIPISDMDTTKSFYEILTGGRNEGDIATDAN